MRTRHHNPAPFRPNNSPTVLIESGEGFSVVSREELRQAVIERGQSRSLQFVGPLECPLCHAPIVAAVENEQTLAFDIPHGQIFPNSAWEPHQCLMPAPRKVSVTY